MCAFYHKCGAFWGKINCAPFCALFGSIMCAFEFRIIRHSEVQCCQNSFERTNSVFLGSHPFEKFSARSIERMP